MAQPHDSLFRAVFSRSEEVAAFLGLLAPELSGVRPEDLTPVPGTFIDEALRSRHTDALWRLAWRGRELLVYFLIEHQSTADRWMGLRAMGYMARIWAAWRAEHGDATSLPPIVPVVLFHGDRSWEEPVDVADLVEIPPELVPWLAPLSPSVRVHVLDLSAASDAELRAGALLLEVALWSFKHIWDPDFFEHLEQWRDHLEALCQAPTGLQAVEQVIRYWMSAARHVPKDAGERLVRALPGPAQEAGMTLADELRREGRHEGHLEGLREGRQEGRREAEVETLRWALETQLEARFGAVPGEARAIIAAAAAPALRRWLLALVSAPTLEAVFRDDPEPSR